MKRAKKLRSTWEGPELCPSLLPIPIFRLSPGMGTLKDYSAPCHSGILEQSDSCTLSWGEPGEALRVPCTQSGKGADEMAVGFSGQPGIPEYHWGSIRNPPTWAPRKEVGQIGRESVPRTQHGASETFPIGDWRPARTTFQWKPDR